MTNIEDEDDPILTTENQHIKIVESKCLGQKLEARKNNLKENPKSRISLAWTSYTKSLSHNCRI